MSKYRQTIKELVDMGAISECKTKKDEFLSSYFLLKKPNGKYRFVLNLKNLNKYISAPHFKIEDYRTILKLVTKNCYFASIDLKDAYFSLPIKNKYRKYLRFRFQNTTYEFNCLPFGLNIGPYIFTKIIRPVLGYLRERGIVCSAYLDDFLIIGHTEKECKRNILKVKNLLYQLGFVLNLEKSELVPKQKIIHLGFAIDSLEMKISLPEERKEKILNKLRAFTGKRECSIRDFARLIGMLIATKPAVKYGWLHLKNMEREKYIALFINQQNYNASMLIPEYIQTEFNWWLKNIGNSNQSIRKKSYSIEIYSDASKTGWGANCAGKTTHGFWNLAEQKFHINYLELLATLYALKSFAKHKSNTNILLRIDNTTAVASINKMGSVRYKKLNEISRKIWDWCESRNIFIHASYISSSDNKIADRESRIENSIIEFQLPKENYQLILQKFGLPTIDLFASYQNKKHDRFVSRYPDPESLNVDAFTLKWNQEYFYAFPPFCLVGRVLEKIINDRATGIVVVPKWPSQAWYPVFHKLLIEEPVVFHTNDECSLFASRDKYSIYHQTTLMAGKLYGGHL